MGKIIEGLKQNTPEWLEWRKDKIGGSDIAAIMGVSKWCTPWQLYMRKLSLISEQDENEAMREGKRRESEALAIFNAHYKCNCIPVVMQHEEYPWMIASLDGWDEEKRIAVEIKCPGKDDHETAKIFCDIPIHYHPQLQHQMCVLGIPNMWYMSYHKEDWASVLVFRSEYYTKDMIEKEKDFMRRIKELDPPDLCDRDYVEKSNRHWQYAVRNYNERKLEKERVERWYEEARQELITLADNHNCKGSGIRMTKSVRKGNIDFLQIPELKDVDLEKYRKESTITWRISEYNEMEMHNDHI